MSMEGEGENSVSQIGSLELLSTIGFEGEVQWNGTAKNYVLIMLTLVLFCM